VKAAHDAFGRIDILVNNAGTSAAAPFEKVTDEGWESDLDLKLMGAVRMSRACIPHMREAGGGRIINITAVGGKAPGPGSLPTTVSRAAGIALTKAMSKDLAKDGILVNAICIGLVKSGQISRAAAARFPGGSLDEAFAQMGKNVPIGRIGEAREVAVLIALLASPLGGFISGTAINVDGGMGAAV
jgi:NAD(P)-dependent dehydrogenase (short-subunit alcohol dehydrogenase family)